MNKKCIFIIVPTLQLGGQEKVAIITAHLLEKFYNIILIIFDEREKVFTIFCPVICINVPAQQNILLKIVNIIKRVFLLYKLKRKYAPVSSISFGTSANIVNVLSGRKTKNIVAIHGYGSSGKGIINKVQYYFSNKIICVSELIREKILRENRLDKEKVLTLYNPYDVNEILQKAQESVFDYSFSPNTIVSMGRLDEVKNFPRLIKAFSLVKNLVSDAKLAIIGEGSERVHLEGLIEKYDLQQSVSLIGFRSNPYAYLAKAKLFVLSSYSEGFPNALVEAMTFLPVVAVDCKSGPREILSLGNINTVATGVELADFGVLIPPAANRCFTETITKDDKILAAGIISLLQNTELAKKYAEKARLRVNDFSCERYKQTLLHIIG